MVAITLTEQHGYVLAVAVLSVIVNMWHGFNTSSYRKAAKIEYPTAYASEELANTDIKAKRFNCAQRAHANYLENWTNFLVLLLVSGISFPTFSAIAGVVFLFGRVIYTIGYSSGDPSQRMKGAIAYLGFFPLLVRYLLTLKD
ncbi:glutathione S-transferase [Acrasis kona]|uniref:Glutathione S-transferase n=1 Tax=Acrasis kona TaxID=1008807 RepID=A0AAW2ZS25_9EUKA